MILLIAGIVLGGIIGIASGIGSVSGDFVSGAITGLFLALVVNGFVSMLWGGVNAHHTDITSKIEQKIVNNEAVFQFKTGSGEWSLPVNGTVVQTGKTAKLITYTGSDASFWWTVFPNVDPKRSPQLVIPLS